MQQEFEAELRIEKIEINPFVMSLRITGLELDNPEGAPTIRVQEIFTNFQLSSLFRLALTFDEVRLTAAELFVTRDETGNMDFAYLQLPRSIQPKLRGGVVGYRQALNSQPFDRRVAYHASARTHTHRQIAVLVHTQIIGTLGRQ